MKTLLILCGGLLFAQAALAQAPNPVNGQKLFTASKCLSCHGTEVFTKIDRKVKDLAGLDAQVRRCDAKLSANWFDDEILDVVAYLNQTYYKFTPPPVPVSH